MSEYSDPPWNTYRTQKEPLGRMGSLYSAFQFCSGLNIDPEWWLQYDLEPVIDCMLVSTTGLSFVFANNWIVFHNDDLVVFPRKKFMGLFEPKYARMMV